MNLQILGAEVKTDPLNIGYAGKTNAQIADLLNALRNVARTSITAAELWENTDMAEYDALTAVQRQKYGIQMDLGTIDVAVGTNSRASLAALFGLTSVTRAKLVALLAVPNRISRANQLGLGEVWPGHVGKALAQWG